jgi:anionic cell wall polymer biosynthesis LytR-Cps2A-Psr (LCP) family protein
MDRKKKLGDNLMKKLIIAVIVFSFLGFGPLQSFFQSDNEGEHTKSIPFLGKVKDSTQSERKIETFLILEESNEPIRSTQLLSAMVLKYDKTNNKMEFGSLLIPTVDKDAKLETLKKEASKKYQVEIDYCFIYDTSGVGAVIDLLAPNGIEMDTGNDGHLAGGRILLKGEDFVNYLEQLKMNPDSANQYGPMFLALKEELMKEISAEKILSLAPQVLNEALKSVKTDIGKGKLMDLGLSVMMNPVTSIEQVDLMADSNNKFENANKMLDGEQDKY